MQQSGQVDAEIPIAMEFYLDKGENKYWARNPNNQGKPLQRSKVSLRLYTYLENFSEDYKNSRTEANK